MNRIVLARHASTYSSSSGRLLGWLDEDLSRQGRREARRLSRVLASELHIEPPCSRIVVTSDLLRASRTASVIARQISCEVHTLVALRERDFGEWSGWKISDLRREQPEVIDRFVRDPLSVDPASSEPMIAFRERVLSAWRLVVALAGRYNYIITVTHDGFMRLLLRELGFKECTTLPLYAIRPGARFQLWGRSPLSRWSLHSYKLTL